MAGTKYLWMLLLLISSSVSFAQTTLVRAGKITYERRTNLYKMFEDGPMRKMVDEKNKIKVEKFTLYFNDTSALFQFVTPDAPDPQSWMTMKNTVYTQLNKHMRYVYMEMMGNNMIIGDSLAKHTWKISDKTRKIAGYECYRAVWEKDDSTNIYAWFTTDIIPSIGPESILGLPGAVLGLATEDGGIVYFATKVEIIDPTAEQVAQPKKKGKPMTEAELKEELMAKLAGQPYGPRIIQGIFFW
jgi:GLPGLI family protein